MKENRAGRFVYNTAGYNTFIPKKLPPQPPISLDLDMIHILSEADRKLGRLDGVTQTLPNPELFVAMYVRKEAVLSSQIEGTQASLSDVLGLDNSSEKNSDISDVVNYVNAMNYGLNKLNELPLSLRLIREIHAVLLKNGRGSFRNPGEFRSSQNWIGPAGCTLQTATFVPPTVPDMHLAMGDLEKYFYEDDGLPPLIKIALIHAQFETIHPFLDGNGRMGRLLITFWLCHEKILSQPLLYLSYFFKKNRSDYYEKLMNVRLLGDWETWIKFFLEGISYVSDEATNTAKDILSLQAECNERISKDGNKNHSKLLELLFQFPVITKSEAAESLHIAVPTAGRIVDDLCELKILSDITPDKQRYKKYMFTDYVAILNRGTELN